MPPAACSPDLPDLPEREQVVIALDGGTVRLAWETRQALLARLQHIRETVRLRASFDAGGATGPVELNRGQRAALLAAIDEWARDGTSAQMPEELLPLRDALAEDRPAPD